MQEWRDEKKHDHEYKKNPSNMNGEEWTANMPVHHLRDPHNVQVKEETSNQ